uniref:Homing endonuclease LAGLIDADG domain-containing protein n=1 Tax=Ulva intestinalis TaxID=3116 RepID=A0A8K1M9W7_ULVIN|nr:hypothetical protein LK039_mgp02 [Ulva intestinalis]UBR43405.1 hypothetical protein [Ulva intestinalis]
MTIIYNKAEMLGFYIAGLFEGDGHIVMPTVFNNHNPRWHITFRIKNKPLAQKLLSKIGYGFIRYKTKHNACVLTVSQVKGLKVLINMINGKFRTPKINQLYLLIDWLNKHHGTQIKKLPTYLGHLSKDAWLAGFIDADGSFGIRYTKKAPGIKQKVSCRFRLEQRMVDAKTNQSYSSVLTLIADYLVVRLNTRTQKSTKRTYYIIEMSSRASIIVLINYLNHYGLLSAKLLDYLDWRKAAQHIIHKTNYTQQGLAEISVLKNNMNTGRSNFNWDHLNDF